MGELCQGAYTMSGSEVQGIRLKPKFPQNDTGPFNLNINFQKSWAGTFFPEKIHQGWTGLPCSI